MDDQNYSAFSATATTPLEWAQQREIAKLRQEIALLQRREATRSSVYSSPLTMPVEKDMLSAPPPLLQMHLTAQTRLSYSETLGQLHMLVRCGASDKSISYGYYTEHPAALTRPMAANLASVLHQRTLKDLGDLLLQDTPA